MLIAAKKDAVCREDPKKKAASLHMLNMNCKIRENKKEQIEQAGEY
jgi:hypothetical protein